jgi:hypothetical protein
MGPKLGYLTTPSGVATRAYGHTLFRWLPHLTRATHHPRGAGITDIKVSFRPRITL